MTKPSSTQYDEPSDVTATRRQKTSPPPPRLHGRLVGSLQGAAAGAARVAVLRDSRSQDVLAHARISPDGSFETAELPAGLRGRSLTVDVIIADPDGPSTAASVSVDIPRTGDASVIVHPGAFGSDAGSLSPSPEVLDPTRFGELLQGHEASTAAFAQMRKAARRRTPPIAVDLSGAAAYLESIRRPHHAVEGLYVPSHDLGSFDSDTVLTHPSHGLRDNPAPRTARLRLTAAEEVTLRQAPAMTVCNAVEARQDQRTLERRPRLRERLELAVRIDRLQNPPPPPAPAPPGPPPAPGNASVAPLAREAERAALSRAANVISDLGPQLTEPSTATDLKRLHALAADLELAGGPANVAAAREVHTLQVAFEQAIMSILDVDVMGDWSDLLEVRRRLRNERGITLPAPPENATHDQVRSYLSACKRVVAANASEPLPQLVRRRYPRLTPHQWARLNDEARDLVVRRSAAATNDSETPTGFTSSEPFGSLGDRAAPAKSGLAGAAADPAEVNGPGSNDLGFLLVRAHRPTVHDNRRDDDDQMSEIEALLESSPSAIAEADNTLNNLQDRLSGSYEFAVFVPGSVNYGLLLTNRQEWSPVRYQVGRLVDTIPLTPGERREFRVVTTRKLHENRKTVTTTSREGHREHSSTRRLESEAIEAATMAINNQLSSHGDFDIGVGSIGGSTQFAQDLKSDSRRTLKNFSEMAQKAVDSVKAQFEVAVETTSDVTTEQAETRTITNPNNEITITYLLYELERRHRVQTQLQRVRPVVLVALPMPSPDQITPAWILEYSWPIREALLDDTLLEVLNGVEEAESGAAVEYEVRRAALIEQSRNSQQLVTEYDGLESAARRRRDEIVRLMEGEGLAEAGEPGTGQRIATGILTGGVSELFGGGTTSADERLQAQREAAQQALGYLEKQIEIKGAAMTAAAEALRRAVDRFTEAAVQRRRTALATARLQVHIRDNIFHYMHAIWAVTHPDNRFFELYDNEVPFHTPNPADYTLRPAPAPAVLQNLPGIEDTGTDLELTIAAPDTTTVPPLRRLADIADLDRPLGFRGNLVIFELRQCSQLTDHMVAEYLDPVSGIADPGALSGISTGELIDYIEAAIQAGILDDGELNRLKEIAHQLHHDQRDWADELVLPTGQLFLEALKGQTTLLEPFKLVHRGLDALSAEEDVRAKRIDALRRVRKLAQSDLERDPTSVEHFYLGEIPGVAVTNGDGSGPGGGE